MPRTLTARTQHSASRPAFTLVELLVVIAIIGTLVGILLPAVQSARERGRQAKCMNNIKNIALALINHENAQKAFPPGVPTCMPSSEWWNTGGTKAQVFCQGPNWALAILPYMEERQLFDQLRACMLLRGSVCDECSVADTANPRKWTSIGGTTPSVFLCASGEPVDKSGYLTVDSPLFLTNLSKGNYAANFGTKDYFGFRSTRFRGAFELVDVGSAKVNQAKDDPTTLGMWKIGSSKGARAADFPDGLTKTVLIGEVIAFNEPTDGRGAWTWPGMGGSLYTALYGPNAIEPDTIAACGFGSNQPEDLPRYCVQESTSSGQVWASSRSSHPQGVFVAFADGSVHMIAEDIALRIWQALHTRQGVGEEDDVWVDNN